LYTAGADAELIDLMMRSGNEAGSTERTANDIAEVFGQPLTVFRRADAGARLFGEGVSA
jgi:hypothetical protein